MKRLLLLILLLTPIASIFHSCRCPDIEAQYITFSHSELRLRNLDNSGATAIESESLQINRNAYGIRLFLTREKDIVARARQINSFFIQSAYAVSFECPPEYIFTARDSVVSIKIFAVNNFDDEHFAGSEITSLFRAHPSFSTIESAVASIENTDEHFLREELILNLLLMFPPTANSLHQFKVQVELSDGRILEQYTTEVELL